MEYVLSFFLLIFCCNSVLIFAIDPLVLTSHGLVMGSRATDGNYSKFLGIPYAKVNTENPFGAPVDSDPFAYIYGAFDDSTVCPQTEDFNYTVVGKLDCLHVNLYVPHTATSQNLLPVMIWIHGGEYNTGSASSKIYGPNFIVRHNVILITFNYRVGIYGFLNLNSEEVPGNAGIKDQLAALRWIKRNAKAFGGNPNSITLFGENSGASSIEFHLVSGLSDDLFHKAILQSGNVLSDWVIEKPVNDLPFVLSRQLGMNTNNEDVAIEFLEEANPLDVVKAVVNLNLTFKPSVEQEFEDNEAVIKDFPSRLLEHGPYYSVPILSGFNKVFEIENYYYDSIQDFESVSKVLKLKLDNYFNFTEQELNEAYKFVKQFYFNNRTDAHNSIPEMIEFIADFSLIHPLQRSTSIHLSRNRMPIYQYIFSYLGDRNIPNRNVSNNSKGDQQGDEIGYLFQQSQMASNVKIDDKLMIELLTSMWANFAKYSDPTPDLNELIPVKWKPTVEEQRRFFIIDKELNMSYHPYHQRMAFWDMFFALYKDKLKW